LLEKELKGREPAIVVNMRIAMTDEVHNTLRIKRFNAWRGFV